MADKRSFDRITRVIAGDDRSRYDGVAITLHWLTALLVLAQFALAETWDFTAHDTRETMKSIHLSFGIVLAFVIIVRLIWRWIPGHLRSSLETGWMRSASISVHYLLYGLLVLQACLGFAIGWSMGRPIHFVGIAIPGPIGMLPRPVRHEVREIHSLVGWTIVILALCHALAAIYHHYYLKDRVLARMLPIAP